MAERFSSRAGWGDYGRAKVILEEHELRIRTKENIHLITLYLDSAARTSLDIGCNKGALSCHLENLGLHVEAFEQDLTCANAITLDVLEKMDNFDVMLFISAYHQIAASYGFDYANKILISLYRKANMQLFFQPAITFEEYNSELPFIENCIKSVFDYFLSVFKQAGESPNFQLLGINHKSPPASESFRPLFLISKIDIKYHNNIKFMHYYNHNDENTNIIYVDTDLCVSGNLQSYSQQGWHYFSACARDILNEKRRGSNILYRYYDKIQCRYIRDAYSIAGHKADIGVLGEHQFKFSGAPIPWEKIDKRAIRYEHDEYGYHSFGPMRSAIITRHIKCIEGLLRKIQLEGYNPELNFDGYIRGSILRKGKESRFAVCGGQHRMGILSALGYRHFLAKFQPKHCKVVVYEEAAAWPSVIDGTFTLEQARAIFNAIFHADGKCFARALC